MDNVHHTDWLKDASLIFTHARVITRTGCLSPGTVAIKAGKILAVEPTTALDNPQCPVYDLAGAYLAPGLIDTHIHGAAGHDFLTANQQEIREIMLYHQQQGSTSLVATLPCASSKVLQTALTTITQAMQQEKGLLGIHLEGPYINKNKSGALDKKSIGQFDVTELATLLSYPVVIMTFAPECIPGNQWADFPVAWSIGHSEADYEQACQAITQGVQYATHFPNTLSGIHHRKPGVALALLQHKKVSLELIADGIHLHHGMVQFLYQVKGAEKLLLISDAVAPTGCPPDATVELWGKPADSSPKGVYYQGGILAGSNKPLFAMMVNFIKMTSCSVEDAVLMASYNPADRLKITATKGEIAPGKDADFIVFDDHYTLLSVMAGGMFLD